MSRKKDRPRVVPEQDTRICRTICLCQLIIVLSIVSMFYLSVAIYTPSYRALNSEFSPEPVMCQTVYTLEKTNCLWVSCGEWCLTRISGYCPQINATVRRPGTDIELRNCSSIRHKECPKVNHNELIHFNCNEKSACSNLTTGFYNCTLGHCYYWHDRYTCNTINDTVTIDAVQNNERLTGFFYCSGTKCTRIKPQSWTCDRRCPSLQIYPNNIVLRFKETVLMTSCESIVAYNVANGSNVGERIEPTTIWNNDSSTMHDLLHASCMTVETFMENGTIRATDCINGTRLRKKSGQIEFPAFRRMVAKSARNVLFKDQRFLPMQSALTIQKTSRLMINLQGCVNSLRDECKEFVQIYGNDGRNNTAQSRYPCYYKPTNSDVVLLYFDLIKMKRQLMISVVIPISLFIVSFISLWCIIRTVKVGDDTKMRFKFAFGEPVADTMANDNELNAMGNKKKKQLQKRLLKDGQTVVAKDIKDKGKKQKTAEKQSAVVGTVEQGLTADVSVHNADGDKTCTIHI